VSPDTPHVHLSAIDEERFGIRTARASHVTMDTLPSVIDFCRINSVVLLIARCPASETRTAQAMERRGFYLMDTLVYYVRDLPQIPFPPETGEISVRLIRPSEEEAVKIVAAESFHGYYGHYHSDERLDRAKCDETYTDWALRSCVSRDAANDILVADLKGTIVGFASLRLNNPGEGEGVLFAVAPAAQGRGIYRSFILHGMEWCRSKGARRMLVSTQIANIAVQKVWARSGFEFNKAYYTFHKWFDTA
jgi:GNAT superfamily N-acetyltransferase